jgi:hypothetical protein
MFVWRLVFEKIISYGDLKELNFIDCLKLNAILDYRIHLEKLEHEKQVKMQQ